MKRLTRLLLLAPTLTLLAAVPARGEEAAPALAAVLEARSADDKARDAARHPAQTLAFFGVEPGMTVAEALPGGGWYTRILASYLGADGTLYGINYPDRMWSLFSWATDDIIKQRIATTDKFPAMVRDFATEYAAATGLDVDTVMPATDGFTFSTVPPEAVGKVDRVLLIRALHNLNRFEDSAGMRSQALAAVRAMLKKDGLVGVVQHRLPESAPEAGADGSRGYLKQSGVIAAFEAAGFELVRTSEINANAKDQPGPDDIVWRLPPSLSGSEEGTEQRAAMAAIGESDRMTLLFRRRN
jgi:predicted methyltransferase